MSNHPKDVPISEWRDGWLMFETASLLDKPEYILMFDSERKAKGFPASREERIAFIKKERKT